MNKHLKGFVVIGASLAFSCSLLLGACGNKVTPPQPYEGYLETIKLGDSILLEDYIEFYEDAYDEYELVVIYPSGKTKDITGRAVFSPDQPGLYHFDYTVNKGNHKGATSFEITVKVTTISYSYTPSKKLYNLGEPLVFDEYFSSLNFYVDSYFDYTIQMDKVEVDGKTIDLVGQSRYVIDSISDHIFQMSIHTEDGQSDFLRQKVEIKDVDTEYFNSFSNISTHGEKKFHRGEITLKSGSCSHDMPNPAAQNHDLGYIAFNGNYGLNDYLVVDFIGNNMPLLSFFSDQYSESIFDNSKGVVICNGPTKCSGENWPVLDGRITMYGPRKVRYFDRDEDANFYGRRIWTAQTPGNATPFPGSMRYLKDTDLYRLIVGFTGVSELGQLEFDMYIKDISTNTVILDKSIALEKGDDFESDNPFRTNKESLNPETGGVTFDDSYFTGSILMYGRYGRETTLANIYPIQEDTNIASILEMFSEPSKFKDDAPTEPVMMNTDIAISSYIAPSNPLDYQLFLINPDGTKENLSNASTFQIIQEGDSALLYKDGNKEYAGMTIEVVKSPYKDDIKNMYRVGSDLLVNDFVNKKNDDYFGYIDLLGNEIEIKGESFKFTDDGDYTLVYREKNKATSFRKITLKTFTDEQWEYVFTNSINMHLVDDFDKDGNVTLPATTYNRRGLVNDPWQSKWATETNLPYFALDNEYGVNDYAVIEFTGNNMPYFDFFAKNYTNHFFYEEGVEGFFISNGMTDDVGKICNPTAQSNRINVVGPYMVGNLDGQAEIQNRDSLMNGTGIGMASLADETKANNNYRMIIGFSNYNNENGRLTLDIRLEDLTEKNVMQTSAELSSLSRFNLTDEYFTGSIVFYGRYATDTTFKIIDIFEDTTMSEIISSMKLEDKTYGDMNLKTYNLDSFTDGGVIGMPKGTATGTGFNVNDAMIVDCPYLEITGNYGANSYLCMEFTGNNMPLISMFTGKHDSSFFYANGEKGMLLSNACTNYRGKVGSDAICKRMNLYGPRMVTNFDNDLLATDTARLGTCGSGTLGFSNLTDGTKYRFIVGVSSFTKNGNYVDTVTFDFYLYNLTTGTQVERCQLTSFSLTGLGFNFTPEELFTGSIVLYGRIGKVTTIDKLYSIQTNTTLDTILSSELFD